MRLFGFLYNLIISRGIIKCSYFGKRFNGEFYDLHNIIKPFCISNDKMCKMESSKNENINNKNECCIYLDDGEVSWDIEDDNFNYNQTIPDNNKTEVSDKWKNIILSMP